MQINYKEAAAFLNKCSDVYILTHQSPDGDTFGSAFALCKVLRNMGKNANVLCSDEFPKRYSFMYENYTPQRFAPKTIIAVDVADNKLLGKNLSQYADYVNLCIDHHFSNTHYSQKLLLNGEAAAACEVIYELFCEMKADIDKDIAECLYTGLATDTGCFKYENTTPRAHIIAAELMEYGVDYAWINRRMFDVKSRARIKIEQYVISNMEFYLSEKCAMIAITNDVITEMGVAPEEFEGLAALTLQLEGVEIGITIKEREKGKYKISMRSVSDADVSAICAKLGGGGHVRAAGCQLEGSLESVKLKLLSAAAPAFGMDVWTV